MGRSDSYGRALESSNHSSLMIEEWNKRKMKHKDNLRHLSRFPDFFATKRILFLIWYTLSVCGFTRGLGVYTIEGFFWLWIHMKPSGDSILGTKKIILIKSRPGRFQQSTTKDKVPLESCYLTFDGLCDH